MGEDFRSLDEIMGAFGYKDKKSFRENYITPALEEDIIERKYPDNLYHPHQKFRLTLHLSTNARMKD